MAAVRTRSRHVPVLELLPNIGLLAVLAVGGRMVLHGSMTVGELVAFNVYVNQLIWPLRALGFVIAMGQRAVAAGERVAEVLDARPAITEPARPVPLPDRPRGEVRFEQVRFAYPSAHIATGRAVLDGFDLVVAPGETVALVGATGSGKSTVPRLLARFYDTGAGTVRLDGVDVRDLSLGELRRAVGIVFEESFLFTDSLGANIAFADPTAGDDAPPVADRVQGWATRNGCDPGAGAKDIASGVTLTGWMCPADGTTMLITITGGGHTWPGSAFDAKLPDMMGVTSTSIDATAMMWDFFVSHPLMSE